MTHTQNLIFREATSEDLLAIIEIHNSNVRGKNTSDRQGFLLTKTSAEEILAKLKRETRYFVAVSSQDEIMGFLALARPKIGNEFLDRIIWQDDFYKNKILSARHIYIQIVATKLDHMGKGIAQFMYKSLDEKFPNTFFSTFIVAKPISNDRSIMFHEKQGFQKIGIIQHDLFLDLKNYESVLMFKDSN